MLEYFIFVIPTTKSIIFPLLEFLEDGKDHTLEKCTTELAKKLELSEEDLRLKYNLGESKSKTKFRVRVKDTVSTLKKRKLIQHSKLAVFHITEQGLKHLNNLRKKN